MDTTQLSDLISQLADLDPAAAPELADQIAEALRGDLEGPTGTDEESTD